MRFWQPRVPTTSDLPAAFLSLSAAVCAFGFSPGKPFETHAQSAVDAAFSAPAGLHTCQRRAPPRSRPRRHGDFGMALMPRARRGWSYYGPPRRGQTEPRFMHLARPCTGLLLRRHAGSAIDPIHVPVPPCRSHRDARFRRACRYVVVRDRPGRGPQRGRRYGDFFQSHAFRGSRPTHRRNAAGSVGEFAVLLASHRWRHAESGNTALDRWHRGDSL